ncbi:MAG: hypothetical protein ACRD9S_24185, partial [Pyrinomonadaceae bacterium]
PASKQIVETRIILNRTTLETILETGGLNISLTPLWVERGHQTLGTFMNNCRFVGFLADHNA